MDDIDKLIMKESVKALGLNLPFNVDEIDNFEKMSETFKFINKAITQLKNRGKLDLNYYLNLHASLKPKNDEYQNFGLMQAMDLINAALYLQKHASFKALGGGI